MQVHAHAAKRLLCGTWPLMLLPCLMQGKERFVFFSFPHIAIDSDGKVGAVSRPNRPSASSACGALIDVSVGSVSACAALRVHRQQPRWHARYLALVRAHIASG
jgi:hypothetical protein